MCETNYLFFTVCYMTSAIAGPGHKDAKWKHEQNEPYVSNCFFRFLLSGSAFTVKSPKSECSYSRQHSLLHL